MEELILGNRPSVIRAGSLLAGTLLTGSALAAPTVPGTCTIQWLDTDAPQRVTVDPAGQAANGNSRLPALSADGGMLTFESTADNLVLDDSGTGVDIFVRDLNGNSTVRASISTEGAEANAGSSTPAVSGDGRWIAFASFASNLASGDRFDARTEVFLHDRQDRSTVRITTPSGYENAERPALDADGSVVAFNAHALTGTVRTRVFVYDRDTGNLETLPNPDGRSAARPVLSDDGRYVAFETAGDDGLTDIHLYDRETGDIEHVSRTPDGEDPDGHSTEPALSGDGRYVAFLSSASNLVPGDGNGMDDVFLLDRDTGELTRVNLNGDGAEANGHSRHPALSAEGRFVGYVSQADNLTPDGAAEGMWHAYVRDRVSGQTVRLSAEAPQTWGWSLSADGRYAAMTTNVPGRVPGETSRTVDVLLYGPLYEVGACGDTAVSTPSDDPDTTAPEDTVGAAEPDSPPGTSAPDSPPGTSTPDGSPGVSTPSIEETSPNPPPPGVSTINLSSLLRVLQPVGPNWFTALLDR